MITRHSRRIGWQIGFVFCFAGILFGLDEPSPAPDEDSVVAKHIVTVSDDFVADVYLNGKKVPDASRHALSDRFGSEAEQDDIEVKKGDWLVFNVVNYGLRWNGNYFFAAAGLMDKEQYGFVSDADSDAWSYCDDALDADRFIEDKDYMNDTQVEKIPDNLLWTEGLGRMNEFAGDGWNGAPIWGKPRVHSVWLKILIN